jgi:chemotaxis regulatin CheY-phosphate phosphatase CheZ
VPTRGDITTSKSITLNYGTLTRELLQALDEFQIDYGTHIVEANAPGSQALQPLLPNPDSKETQPV